MKRNYWIDIYFCSLMIFFIVSAYVLSYISSTTGVLGEHNVISIERRIFEDVTFMSVWCTTFALIFFIVKLFLTITRGKPVYFKYTELSVCVFGTITMLVTVVGMIMKISPPFESDISRYRMVVNHFLIPISMLTYVSVFRINYIYSPKEILIAAIPNSLIVALYTIWVTFVFSNRVIRNENVPFPYKGMNYTDIGVPTYVGLIILAIILYGFFTSMAMTINNLIIIKYYSQKFEENYFKQNIFNGYENYERTENNQKRTL